MLGVIVNVIAVLAGSMVGLVCRKGIPDKFKDAIMLAIGICTFYIGIKGALKGDNELVAIISMVLGVAVGTALDLDGKVNGMAKKVEERFSREEGGRFSQGLVTAFLLWCVGAMTIVGSLESGINGNHSMIFTKSLLDLISSSMLASSLGVGVIFATVPLLIFQGGLVLLSGLIAPLLTEVMISEITCVGSLLILALGLNLIGITKIKVVNFLPAIFFAPFVCQIMAAVMAFATSL